MTKSEIKLEMLQRLVQAMGDDAAPDETYRVILRHAIQMPFSDFCKSLAAYQLNGNKLDRNQKRFAKGLVTLHAQWKAAKS